jgi:hypothetical protein
MFHGHLILVRRQRQLLQIKECSVKQKNLLKFENHHHRRRRRNRYHRRRRQQ